MRLEASNDASLDALAAQVRRIRDVATSIRHEVDVHHQLLDGMDVDVDAASRGVDGSRRRLALRTGGWTYLWVLVGLLVLLFLHAALRRL